MAAGQPSDLLEIEHTMLGNHNSELRTEAIEIEKLQGSLSLNPRNNAQPGLLTN